MAVPEPLPKSTQPRALAALGLLSLLWALGSLRSDLLPQFFPPDDQLPFFQRLALPLILFALAAAAFALIRKSPWPRGRSLVDTLFVSLGLFVAPGVLLFLAADGISDLSRVALYSLAPVFAAVLEPHLGRPDALQRSTSLLAPLVAVAGTFCLFPLYLPQSIAAACSFAAVLLAVVSVAAANCFAVRIASELPPAALLPFAALASGAAGLVFSMNALLSAPVPTHPLTLVPTLLWSAFVDLPSLALLFWLLPRLSATRMTTRFLVAPLFTNLLALALFRPPIDLRELLGLVLVILASGSILLTPPESPPSGNSQLNLPNQ
ncbi:MAG TPA: DMT family transporter [Terracidiphilus sp.]|jgi:drug/metabolite transporter (DMT)-like permease|nr:DMT family transporter [Terracidiphilus sp.]